jgi:pimeloyl-ACP methyl ester carboxylesterase
VSKRPQLTVQKRLNQMALSTWLLLAGLALALVVLHRFGIINAWRLPLKPVGIFLAFGGGCCFLLSGVLQIIATKGNRTFGRASTRLKPIYRLAFIAFIALNVITYTLAYGMTHVRPPGYIGLGVPKPQNERLPTDIGLSYVTHRIPINQSEWLESWFIPTQQAPSKGTILLFPGNLGTKGSQLVSPAQSFSALGYDTLLVDFRGVGGSSGNMVTFGMREAEDVATAVSYARQLKPESAIILYGVSMGSAAILRAISVEKVKPNGVILELPFARLVDAVRSRLQDKKIPPFPTAELLVFWGGLQHGFNGLSHNPANYAKAVQCPALVLHGERDKWTSVTEIEKVFQNLQGAKKLVISPQAGHHQLIGVDRQLWENRVAQFLELI